MIKEFKRVTYKVPNLEKAQQWYSDILKMPPIYETPFGVIFKINDSSLSLIPATGDLSPDNERISVYWEVDDIDESFKQLIAAGAIRHTEVTSVAGIRIAKVVDPFGNIIGLSGKDLRKTNRTVEEQPSETALNVAFCRALAANDESCEIKGTDYLAEIFLTEEQQAALKNASARQEIITKKISTRLYGYLLARTIYIDKIFEQALHSNFPQIVFLGAGYDTRTYRFTKLIKDTKIFEVDIHTTQARKKQLLLDANIIAPPNLSFVSVNFQKDNLGDILISAGYDKLKKTLFIWEGVTYYLTAESVNAILSFINSHSPDGSSIVFDCVTQKLDSRNAGEPFQFWVEEANMKPFLSEHGFAITEYLGYQEIEKRYLTSQSGKVVYNSLPFFCFVNAVVENSAASL